MIAIARDDPRYPRSLRDLVRPPDPLWVEGDASTLGRASASVVGTRRMTPYGARVARELASAVASAGVVVVSGLAQGIDSAAHEAAIEARGETVAVLGAGIASYMRETSGRRRRLAHAIREHGALVSEFPPDAPPLRWTFPQRNATIAALGAITVVVEAPHGSGALITADIARTLARPLYAVPGPLGASASEGTNALIASGVARAVSGAAMLLAALGAAPASNIAPPDPDAEVLDALAAGPLDPDALARRIGVSTMTLTTIVARLGLRGRIATAPDGRLVRR